MYKSRFQYSILILISFFELFHYGTLLCMYVCMLCIQLSQLNSIRAVVIVCSQQKNFIVFHCIGIIYQISRCTSINGCTNNSILLRHLFVNIMNRLNRRRMNKLNQFKFVVRSCWFIFDYCGCKYLCIRSKYFF